MYTWINRKTHQINMLKHFSKISQVCFCLWKAFIGKMNENHYLGCLFWPFSKTEFFWSFVTIINLRFTYFIGTNISLSRSGKKDIAYSSSLRISVSKLMSARSPKFLTIPNVDLSKASTYLYQIWSLKFSPRTPDS